MKRQIAISDIHGCNRSFQALLDRMAFSKSDELFLLGDFVDRGPDSKGVIDTIWQLEKEGHAVHCLMGNHEQMAVGDLKSEVYYNFKGSGDEDFLASFGKTKPSEVPKEYYQWMDGLQLYLEIPGHILVHAGLSFKSENPFDDEFDLTWIRDWYSKINYDWLGDRTVIHGHTPLDSAEIKAMVKNMDKKKVVNVDAGCSTTALHRATLCGLDLTNRVPHFQPCLDF